MCALVSPRVGAPSQKPSHENLTISLSTQNALELPLHITGPQQFRLQSQALPIESKRLNIHGHDIVGFRQQTVYSIIFVHGLAPFRCRSAHLVYHCTPYPLVAYLVPGPNKDS